MEKYNYYEAVRNDVSDNLCCYATNEELLAMTKDNISEIAEKIFDGMWTADSVTGNGSGSYFFSTWKSEEALCHNFDLLTEALEEFGITDINPIEKGAEWCDVTIRCHLLYNAIDDVLSEFLKNNIADRNTETA